ALKEDVAAKDFGLAVGGIECELRDKGFVRIADDVAHLGKRGKFFGRALRIATRDDDVGIWIARADATNRLPDITVGLGGDSTGVHDHHVGVVGGVGWCAIGRYKLLVDRRAFGLGSAAAEINDVKSFRHDETRTTVAPRYSGSCTRRI